MSLKGNAESGGVLRGKINRCDVLTLSAYGIAVKNGFEGTEAEWLESLKGAKGEKGDPGTADENGVILKDQKIGTMHKIYVSDGKLTMEVV